MGAHNYETEQKDYLENRKIITVRPFLNYTVRKWVFQGKKKTLLTPLINRHSAGNVTGKEMFLLLHKRKVYIMDPRLEQYISRLRQEYGMLDALFVTEADRSSDNSHTEFVRLIHIQNDNRKEAKVAVEVINDVLNKNASIFGLTFGSDGNPTHVPLNPYGDDAIRSRKDGIAVNNLIKLPRISTPFLPVITSLNALRDWYIS